MLKKILNHFKYYKISDLQIGGHCGMCGKYINEIFDKIWPWGLCEDCKVNSLSVWERSN
jgi:hypothetical protein